MFLSQLQYFPYAICIRKVKKWNNLIYYKYYMLIYLYRYFLKLFIYFSLFTIYKLTIGKIKHYKHFRKIKKEKNNHVNFPQILTHFFRDKSFILQPTELHLSFLTEILPKRLIIVVWMTSLECSLEHSYSFTGLRRL